MHRGAVLRVFSTVFLIVTMLGANQSFAQDDIPQGTPVQATEDTLVEDQPPDPPGTDQGADLEDEAESDAEEAQTDPAEAPTMLAEPASFSLLSDSSVEHYTISGQVTYRDGTPYSNGVVPFWHDTLSNGWTDDDGYYTITDVPNGNYQIGGAFAPGFGSDVYEVTVEDGNAVQNLIVAWSPTIGGEITDADGNPISAQVCFAQRCTTAENGLYQMVADSDEEIVVTVSHDGYVTQSKTVINDGPIANHDLNFVLQLSDDGEPTIPDGWELVTGPDMVVTMCLNGTTIVATIAQLASGDVYVPEFYLAVDGAHSGDSYIAWPDLAPEITRGECEGEEPVDPGNGGDDGNGDNGTDPGNGDGDNGDTGNGGADGDNGNGQNGAGNGNSGGQNGGANGNGDGGGQNDGSSGNADGSSGVTGLPETGTGTDSVNITLWLATAASVMMTAGALLIRQKRT